MVIDTSAHLRALAATLFITIADVMSSVTSSCAATAGTLGIPGGAPSQCNAGRKGSLVSIVVSSMIRTGLDSRWLSADHSLKRPTNTPLLLCT